MRLILMGLFLTGTLYTAHAQTVKLNKVIDSAAVWSKGEIVMADTKKLNGLVRYNKLTGLLQFENDTNIKTLTPASVLSFTFYDSLQQKQRKFISYGFEDMKSLMDSLARTKGITPFKVNPKFFEILMEFNSFAVLCMTGPLTVTASNGSIGSFSLMTGMFNLASARQPSTTYSYMEQLYIFDKDGKVMPLLMIFNRKKDGLLFDMDHTRRFGKMADIIIQRYTGPHFHQIDDYAYEKKLSYERKEDILKMFEYYRTLITN
jgi:hypothetical protein